MYSGRYPINAHNRIDAHTVKSSYQVLMTNLLIFGGICKISEISTFPKIKFENFPVEVHTIKKSLKFISEILLICCRCTKSVAKFILYAFKMLWIKVLCVTDHPLIFR